MHWCGGPRMSSDAAPNAAASAPGPAAVVTPAGRGLAVTALLVAVLGAGGAVYWVERVYEPAQIRLAEALASNDRGYTGLGGELRALREKLIAIEQAAAARAAALATLTDEVTRITAELAAPATSSANLLRIGRVEHLVRSADLSLRLARDIGVADTALAAAQQELDGSAPLEAALHQSLAADRSSLAAIAEPDVAALGAQWADIARKIDGLPWRAGDPAATTGEPPAAPPAAATWRGIAASIWHDLLNLVEIRDTTAVDAAVLDPSREALVRAGLKSEITLLRAALFARDQRTVRASAAALRAALEQHFDAADGQVAAALTALATLETLELAPELPALDTSLRRLSALQAVRHPAPPPAATAPAPATEPARAPATEPPDTLPDALREVM